MILHTHFLLHLYLIKKKLYYLLLINTKSRFERDKVSKIKKKTEEDTVWQRLTKKLWRPRVIYLFNSILIHISSKGKLNMLVISSLLF